MCLSKGTCECNFSFFLFDFLFFFKKKKKKMTRYVHGWLGHQFSGESGLSLSLNARARQFSSFVLLVGRIVGTGLFDPSCALIVKVKDVF
jgi:hypothetical protein